jgi:prepilin signal peptidase PulO-like enzyme (type II secretory pathway)
MTAVTTSFGAVLAAAFGVILGSFLNVVAYRLPRGESL